MTENVETSQASASIEDDSENTKLSKIIELMMENAKSMKDRMSLLEAENMELRARVSELEGNQNVAPHTQTPVFSTNVTQREDTHDVHNTPSSPVSSLISQVIEETHHLQTSASSPLSTLFENGADVEIATSDDATCRIWYHGNVFATNLCDGVEKVAVTLFADEKRVTVTADKIRPKPPADDREKKFEMMDNVEAFYSKGWSSGQVRMILGDNTFSVYLNSSMETLEFKASDLRIHREWLDGVWKMADETPLHEAASDKMKPIQIRRSDIRNGVEMLKVEYSTWFRDKEKRTKKLQESVSIDKIRPQPPPGDTKDAAFAMLNQKRIEKSSWFSEQGIPKACFVPVQFFEAVGYSYENLQKPDKKGINILKGWVGEVVGGLMRPNKMWMQDVDIVYGVVHERLVDHFIGVEIHLTVNTITIFQCGVHKRSVLVSLCENRVIIEMMLIHAIKLEMMNEEINFNDIVSFQVKKAEGLPNTKLPFNCGLFVVKMLECRSLGLKKMSSINDDTAMDLRSKLCCEMFDLFMDKDFQEGCRR
ncbi:hypothetical protein Bca52824_047289 [Brassica carinata]|uniref:Agenet domain-containing protein n=1 Tax=Brassica carinata TaxID=52824 RepID=A0A8X7UPU3_BRACI|nr:hypothetical protein Bca52824_047289 [Brassica carinata]